MWQDGNWELKQEKFNLEFGLTEKEEYRWTIPVSFKSINEDLTDMSGMKIQQALCSGNTLETRVVRKNRWKLI